MKGIIVFIFLTVISCNQVPTDQPYFPPVVYNPDYDYSIEYNRTNQYSESDQEESRADRRIRKLNRRSRRSRNRSRSRDSDRIEIESVGQEELIKCNGEIHYMSWSEYNNLSEDRRFLQDICSTFKSQCRSGWPNPIPDETLFLSECVCLNELDLSTLTDHPDYLAISTDPVKAKDKCDYLAYTQKQGTGYDGRTFTVRKGNTYYCHFKYDVRGIGGSVNATKTNARSTCRLVSKRIDSPSDDFFSLDSSSCESCAVF